jgi:hypothetical protein
MTRRRQAQLNCYFSRRFWRGFSFGFPIHEGDMWTSPSPHTGPPLGGCSGGQGRVAAREASAPLTAASTLGYLPLAARTLPTLVAVRDISPRWIAK